MRKGISGSWTSGLDVHADEALELPLDRAITRNACGLAGGFTNMNRPRRRPPRRVLHVERVLHDAARAGAGAIGLELEYVKLE